MSQSNLYREYRLKAYLNMNHYITIQGKPGQVHPHTWEFVFIIIISDNSFVEFGTVEKMIEGYLDKYQNKVMNEIQPFDLTNPTIENVTDTFAQDVYDMAKEHGWVLKSLEGSESPTRSYIVSNKSEKDFITTLENVEKNKISEIIDHVISDMK